MELIWSGLFLLSLWLTWRDYRAGFSKTHQWVIPKVSRGRAVVLTCVNLSWWVFLGVAILFPTPKSRLSPTAIVLMVLTMLVMQVTLARRSEFFQPRGDAGKS